MSATATAPLEFLPLFRKVQAAGEDHEWYPTTNEILTALIRDLGPEVECSRYHRTCSGFLDIGAGNGKVIDAVRKIQGLHQFHAIEKSSVLMQSLPADVFILGVDFWNTSLIDKKVGYIFSNPPYSKFEEWSAKILREAPGGSIVYLVIPQRWERSSLIARETDTRKLKPKILGTFDFEDAEDRTARAKVHLLRIPIPDGERWIKDHPEDPFVRFFNETFTFPADEEATPFEQQVEQAQVVHRLNFIEALCHLYDMRMAELQANYQAVCSLSADILKEFEISRASLIESLRQKLATAKKEYWQRLFDGMEEINSRLTTSSRKKIIELMQSRTGIEFNRDNAYAVVLWVIKNANSYFDAQLIETYEQLVDGANVDNYVSNQRVFQWNRFRYDKAQDAAYTHYRLKVGHRMVIHRCGGIDCGYRGRALSERSRNLLSDLCVLAHNLGFEGTRHDAQQYAPPGYAHQTRVTDSTPFVIRYRAAEGKWESLIRTRAFENGNLHLQFHPDFIHALNVQHGKLKGWLRNDAEAADELQIPADVARKFFKPGFRLTSSALALMAPAA